MKFFIIEFVFLWKNRKLALKSVAVLCIGPRHRYLLKMKQEVSAGFLTGWAPLSLWTLCSYDCYTRCSAVTGFRLKQYCNLAILKIVFFQITCQAAFSCHPIYLTGFEKGRIGYFWYQRNFLVVCSMYQDVFFEFFLVVSEYRRQVKIIKNIKTSFLARFYFIYEQKDIKNFLNK